MFLSVFVCLVLVSNPTGKVSYARPVVTLLDAPTCTQVSNLSVVDCNRTSQANFTLFGTNFGSVGAVVFIGGKQVTCIHDSVTPHSQLHCTFPIQAGTQRALFTFQQGGRCDCAIDAVSFV